MLFTDVNLPSQHQKPSGPRCAWEVLSADSAPYRDVLLRNAVPCCRSMIPAALRFGLMPSLVQANIFGWRVCLVYCGRGEALGCRGIPALNQWSIAEAVINQTHYPPVYFRFRCNLVRPWVRPPTKKKPQERVKKRTLPGLVSTRGVLSLCILSRMSSRTSPWSFVFPSPFVAVPPVCLGRSSATFAMLPSVPLAVPVCLCVLLLLAGPGHVPAMSPMACVVARSQLLVGQRCLVIRL